MKEKILIIGGNRFVGLRVSMALDKPSDTELHILNRTGQVRHVKNAVLHKGNRTELEGSYLDREWDAVIDFAAFTAADARESIRFFKKIGRYIFISTGSVYGPGAPWTEAAFDPAKWVLHDQPTAEEKENPYQFGKRQAEAVFTQEAHFPVAHIRFPFILRPDDYTHRLSFHYDRVLESKPIFMPAPKARVSMVQSEDAANFLLWSLSQSFTGPVNVASPEGLGLDEMLKMIEKATGKKSLLVNTESDSNHSPYGVPEDFVLDIKKVQALGYSPRSLKFWLPELIESMGEPGRRSHLH